MDRSPLHIGTRNLDEGIRFYSALFGAEPVKTKSDYAKWVLDNPHVNFAISTRAETTGVDHLGIQVEAEGELAEIRERLKNADMSLFDEGETVCCYARSEKSWVRDPSGVPWEAYRTMEDAQIFSDKAQALNANCCVPETKGKPGCCEPTEKTAGCCG